MVYEKDKIKRLIEYKDNFTQGQLKNDLEWILECYNEYFINSKEYEDEKKQYRKITNLYYNECEEKEKIKEDLCRLKNRYIDLKQEYNICCKKLKNMI